MKNNNGSSQKTFPTVLAISVLSSCIMLAAVGSYRLSASKNNETKEDKTGISSASDTDGSEVNPPQY